MRRDRWELVEYVVACVVIAAAFLAIAWGMR